MAEKAAAVASRPYDVINTEEARKEAEGNPLSFLHVVKPEIDFADDQDPYADEVYEKGAKNFEELISNGTFLQDTKECLYLYRLTMHGRSQTGIVACAAIEDYFSGVIKKHELTRPDKEEDRKQHVRTSSIHAEPVFFAYPSRPTLKTIVNNFTQKPGIYDFVANDGIRHELWVVDDGGLIEEIIKEFSQIPATYVADGHHRTAAGAYVGREKAEQNEDHTGDEEYNYFLAVHFPDDELQIIDYNRVVKDLNGLSQEEFLKKLLGGFEITAESDDVIKPEAIHTMSMYLNKKWYRLQAKAHTYDDNDPIKSLDVTVLSEQILEPLLGIKDLRTDKRIDFVGGIRGLEELQRRVDNGEMKVAFALYPVSMQQLMAIADTGQIMPPKTTWFEPKLRSGLVVHKF